MNPRTAPSLDAGGLLLTAAFAGLCLVYIGWAWADDLTELGGDSAVYMMMARHFSPLHPASAVIADAVRSVAYPPLFPLLIAIAGGSMLAGHLVAVCGLLGAVLLLYTWLRDEGFGRADGALLAGTFALMPGTYLLSLHIWSENPCLLLSFAAILLVSRAAKGEQVQHLLWFAAAAVALATLTRAAALPLLGAFALHLVLRRPPHWLGMLAVAALPCAAWAALGRSQQAGMSSYLVQLSGGYGGNDAAVFLARVGGEARRLHQAWIEGWIGKAGLALALRLPISLLGLLCLLGCFWRLRRLHFDAVYAALYMLLLLIWPFPAEAERLSYIITPVLLAQGLMLMRAFAARTRHPRLPGLAYIAVAAILLLPPLLLNIQRYRLPVPMGLTLLRHTAEWYGDDRLDAVPAALVTVINLDELRRIGPRLAPGNCILSIKPSIVTLYTGHASYVPPPIGSDDVEFEHGLLRCRYAYAMALVSPTFPQPFYPLGRMNGRGAILWTAEGGDERHWDTYGTLVNLRP